MDSYLLYDLIILAILVVFAIHGAYRGFVLMLCGLLAIIVAFVGASFAADTLSPKVADLLEPRFASAIEARLDTEIYSSDAASAPDASDSDHPDSLDRVLNALHSLGLYQSAVDTIRSAVQSGMTDVAANTAAAVAASVAQKISYMLTFAVSFILILVLWGGISRALDLVARLPGLHALNRFGGALLGLVRACIFLFLAAWLMRYFGNIIPEKTVQQTTLLRFFLTTNPVSLILNA
ncbi:MAG: CvpA family protein [Intestinimonas sp.]|nr:CvpA family protein [Intestinimonas sp.]